MLKKLLKNSLERLLPNQFEQYRLRYGNSEVDYRLRKAITEREGASVLDGPFAGMLYGPTAVCSAYWPKILGCYEEELHPVISQVVAAQYPMILDVGCAEGYYAVGLAIKSPTSHIHAFDTDAQARQLCQEMLRLNDVGGRVTVEGTCDIGCLNALPLNGALLICDCEGYELELLRPDLAPGLTQCDLLVELHDCFYSGLTPAVLARFASTHEIDLIDTAIRHPEVYFPLRGLRRHDQTYAVEEARPGPMQWAYMRTKVSHQIV